VAIGLFDRGVGYPPQNGVNEEQEHFPSSSRAAVYPTTFAVSATAPRSTFGGACSAIVMVGLLSNLLDLRD
jgi:hypothetical protein